MYNTIIYCIYREIYVTQKKMNRILVHSRYIGLIIYIQLNFIKILFIQTFLMTKRLNVNFL